MARSGQIAVTTAGTAQRGPDEIVAGRVAIIAHPSNTGAAWVGDDDAGDIAATNGFPLLPTTGEPLIIRVNNLRDLWFDVTTSTNRICWIKLD